MSKIRLGFIGVGGMGQAAHLRNYMTVPDCQVVAIAELRPDLGKNVAARYGVPKVYPSHRELMAAEQVDGLVAIQPFGMHVDLIPELIAKGVPILTEKPLAESYESGQKIIAALERSKVQHYLAYHKRSDPATAYARRQMELWQASGEVGKLKYIRAAMPPGDWSVQGFSQNVHTVEKYEAKRGMGSKYGDFVNYYIHQVNLLRFLLAEDYRVQFADPNGVVFVGRSDSGVTVTLEMATHHTTLDWQEEAFIAFERGWIKIELPAPLAIDRPGRVTVFRDAGKDQTPTTTIPTLPWKHAMRRQAEHFVNAIRGEKTPLCTAAEGLKDLQVAQQYIAAWEQSEKSCK